MTRSQAIDHCRGTGRHALTDLYGFIGTAAVDAVILATWWSRRSMGPKTCQ